MKGRIKIKGAQDSPTLKDERVPIKNELRSIFFAGDEKSRVACALMAQGGLRPETIGNYRGNDGSGCVTCLICQLINKKLCSLKFRLF